MKRLALVLTVVGLAACSRSPDATPAADTTAAPAAAPAMGDTSKMMGDSSKMMGDTKKGM